MAANSTFLLRCLLSGPTLFGRTLLLCGSSCGSSAKGQGEFEKQGNPMSPDSKFKHLLLHPSKKATDSTPLEGNHCRTQKKTTDHHWSGDSSPSSHCPAASCSMLRRLQSRRWSRPRRRPPLPAPPVWAQALAPAVSWTSRPAQAVEDGAHRPAREAVSHRNGFLPKSTFYHGNLFWLACAGVYSPWVLQVNSKEIKSESSNG